ncbi:MAG TPA: hypothetical protein VFV38_12735, partial [Ktedonobacteraceae bacterium]|nr:hypothetical protein [Ktedonobacteraceae bacterium]
FSTFELKVFHLCAMKMTHTCLSDKNCCRFHRSDLMFNSALPRQARPHFPPIEKGSETVILEPFSYLQNLLMVSVVVRNEYVVISIVAFLLTRSSVFLYFVRHVGIFRSLALSG